MPSHQEVTLRTDKEKQCPEQAGKSKRKCNLEPVELPEPPKERTEPWKLALYPTAVQEAQTRSMAREELSALRRFSPRRNRWKEIVEFDKRVAELEQRLTAKQDELRQAQEARSVAPAKDDEALAAWIGQGEKGNPPEPTADALDCRIAQVERECGGLRRATDDLLDAKAAYVEQHRRRLVRDSQRHTDKAKERYEHAIAEMAEARADLCDSRATTMWAATFPDRAAGQSPPAHIVGNARRELERANVQGQLSPEQVVALLRADAEWLATVVTQAQAEAMNLARDDAATWTQTPEGQEAERKEKDEALKWYREMFGTDPGPFWRPQ